MPKRGKGVVLDSTPAYGVDACEDARARLKHQTLVQDYQELQKEVDVVRSRLEAGKQRKMMLAAEVRFLQKRYEYLMKMKAMDSSQKGKQVLKPAQHTKEFGRKEANPHMLPLIPEAKPKKKKQQYIGKEVALRGTYLLNQQHMKMSHGGKEAAQQSSNQISDLTRKGRMDDSRKKTLIQNRSPVLDLNDSTLRNTAVAFDLNRDNNPIGKEASFLPIRAPIFDLNEISTGEEDFHSNVGEVYYEDAKRRLTRHPNDEVQNDLISSVCRNAGEGPSRVGKRKISWQDPVALRV